MKSSSESRLLVCCARAAGFAVGQVRNFVTVIAMAGIVSACGGDAGRAGGPVSPPPPVNQPPVISGLAASVVVADTPYSFLPQATDPEGDAVSFSISGLPGWASFDSSSGALTGLPSASDVGAYANIVISATAAAATSSLPAFDIDVVQMAPGSLSIAWTAPTLNADGSPLSDLAGFRVRWGTQSGVYPYKMDITDAAATTFVIDNLVPAEYFLVIAAFDSFNNESEFSAETFGVVE